MPPEVPQAYEPVVLAAQSGDLEAFGALVEQFTPLIMAFLLGQLKHREDAEDVAQATFVAAFRHLNQLRAPAALPAWLLRLARNAAMDHRRQKSADKRGGHLELLSLDAIALAQPAAVEGAASQAEAREFEALVMQEIAALDETKGVVLRMRLIAEASVPEIAEALEISEEAVRMRLSRGLRELRQRLRERGVHAKKPAAAEPRTGWPKVDGRAKL